MDKLIKWTWSSEVNLHTYNQLVFDNSKYNIGLRKDHLFDKLCSVLGHTYVEWCRILHLCLSPYPKASRDVSTNVTYTWNYEIVRKKAGKLFKIVVLKMLSLMRPQTHKPQKQSKTNGLPSNSEAFLSKEIIHRRKMHLVEQDKNLQVTYPRNGQYPVCPRNSKAQLKKSNQANCKVDKWSA